MKVTRVGVVAFLLACGLSAGCGGLSKDRYDKISNGMTRAEVEGVLGKGTDVAMADVDITALVVHRTGPPGPGESPEPTQTRAGVPPMADLKEKAKWVRWGDDKQFIAVAFIDDKVVAKTAKIPNK